MKISRFDLECVFSDDHRVLPMFLSPKPRQVGHAGYPWHCRRGRLPVSDYVYYYAADLARASRPVDDKVPKFITQYVSFGAGPRAAQYLILGAKSRAILDGRVNVSCNDVRAVAANVLRHRLVLNFNAHSDNVTADHIIARLVETVPEPEAGDLEKK